MNSKVFVSWSGGKDAYLALLKAQEAGLAVSTLATFFREDNLSLWHGIKQDVIAQQAAALGLNLEVEPISYWDSGEALLRVMARLRQSGFAGGVFGDINSQTRRRIVQASCSHVGITMHMPLWGMAEDEILAELQQRGCRLLIVAVRHDLVNEKWLGRELDDEFTFMCKRSSINPCGERGEFHTLAVDGPLFKNPLQLVPGEIIKTKDIAYLQLC